MRKLAILCIIALAIGSCESYNDSKIMDSIKEIEFDDSCILLEEDTLVLDGLYTGTMWAKDSLLFFFSSKFAGFNTYVFNKNTRGHIASLFSRGEGPHEYPRGVSVTWDICPLKNGDWGIGFYNDLSEYHLINVSRSVRENKDIVGSVIPCIIMRNMIKL